MADEILKLQMEFVKDLEKSFIVLNGEEEVYIPRSLVSYRRKWVEGKGTAMIEFSLPQWKVEQEELDEYVVD